MDREDEARKRETIEIAPGVALTVHDLRQSILEELHARPFFTAETPRRFVHLAFMTDEKAASADREALVRLCRAQDAAPPEEGAKHHQVGFGDLALRWEQHPEFTTYTFHQPLSTAEAPLGDGRFGDFDVASAVKQPGPLLVACELALLDEAAGAALLPDMDWASLAVAEIRGGAALAITDFRHDEAAFTRIVLANRTMDARQAGAAVQTLLEIETYRTLALLALPEARDAGPIVREIEEQLGAVSAQMTHVGGLEQSRDLLDRLTAMAAELEAESARTDYRFGATRAYEQLLHLRLDALEERPHAEHATWSGFLARRMDPAMRTTEAIEARQAKLATKLSRTANLLRTRVDVQLESQNRDLLRSMNERTRLQLRLQQAIERFTVAAICYYVVSLIYYLAVGLDAGGLRFNPDIAAALAVPLVVGIVGGTFLYMQYRHRRAERPANRRDAAQEREAGDEGDR